MLPIGNKHITVGDERAIARGGICTRRGVRRNTPRRGGNVDEPSGPPGKRYRLRGLIAVVVAGLVCWALIILLLVKLFG